MKLNQINYFLKVCNTLNITQAAKELHISQPSLTVALKSLEQELGVTLFLREKNKLCLTNEGEYFRNRLKPIIQELDDLEREMLSIGSHYNVLKVGIPPMIGSFLFSLIFTDIVTKNADIRLEIVEHGALKLQELLLEEKLDLTFLLGESQLNSEIEFTPIRKRDIKLHINKKHPLANSDFVKITDLKELPLITFNSEFYVSNVTQNAFRKEGINPNIILETSQINTITRFIHENLAASLLIEGCIPQADDISIIPIQNIDPVTLGYAKKKDRYTTKITRQMIQFIESKSKTL